MIPDTEHNPPLLIAIDEDHFEVCELLIKEGAFVNHKMINGWTPLLIASLNGKLKICELLIKEGASVNEK